MRLQLKGQIIINAPADKVWRVLAHAFANIGEWASAIPESKAATDVPLPNGAEIGGRICSTSVAGYGAIQEDLTHYDEQAMRFGYRAKETPAFVQRAENHWAVRPLGPNQSEVEARGQLDLPLLPGLLLAPLIKLQMKRVGSQTFEELKYFVEQNQPHPRKRKAQQKRVPQATDH